MNKKHRQVIDLRGPEGNAFYILGVAHRLARGLKLDDKVIETEMMADDYDNLIRVFKKYFDDYIELVGEPDFD